LLVRQKKSVELITFYLAFYIPIDTNEICTIITLLRQAKSYQIYDKIKEIDSQEAYYDREDLWPGFEAIDRCIDETSE